MSDSHPWRDSVQTVLFVVGFPLIMLGAIVMEHAVGWVTYATAAPAERRHERRVLLVIGVVGTLVVGISTADPYATGGVVVGVLSLYVLAELARGVVAVAARLGLGRARRALR